jgi:hypothetical protein
MVRVEVSSLLAVQGKKTTVVYSETVMNINTLILISEVATDSKTVNVPKL